EQAGAHGGERLLDARLGAFSDGHHGDDRGHTDDDPQSGQERPHPVAQQRPGGDAQDREIAHACAPCSATASGTWATAWVWRWSDTTSPSFIRTTRVA